jgi:tRNA 2-selenouridine synthase
MSVRPIDAAAAVARPQAFDAVIDVRSPAEFAEDHLPGAVNWPVLGDDERRIVGTLYVQVSPHEARKVGAAMVARNIAGHIEQRVREQPKQWHPLVYCWRGGQRSGSLAWFLGQIGFRTSQLSGGYKAFRNVVRSDLALLPQPLSLRVLCGRTGSGKTRLLHALQAAGAQVLDLEGLACHRGSVLGALPEQPQPSQKRFDTLLWQALRNFDAARPVYVESESRKVGLLHLPDALLAQMREHGTCLDVTLPDEERVALLLEDYGHHARQCERFCRLLDGLVQVRGRAVVQRWQQAARAGQWAGVFADLMHNHYDPLYHRSSHSHYAGLGAASVVALPDRHAGSLQDAARKLIDSEGA